MKYDGDYGNHNTIVTFDIETTHYDPDDGETVAIGVGQHDSNSSTPDRHEIFTRRDHGIEDERKLVKRAFEFIDRLDADTLVSYNGIGFDIDFLYKRSAHFDSTPSAPELHKTGQHIDLFAGRKEACGSKKYPSLEECLDSYDFPIPKTVWNGAPLDNSRFGKEFGPEFLNVVANGDDQAIGPYRDVLDHYLKTDLEANLALYYADQGRSFDPDHLGLSGEFQT